MANEKPKRSVDRSRGRLRSPEEVKRSGRITAPLQTWGDASAHRRQLAFWTPQRFLNSFVIPQGQEARRPQIRCDSRGQADLLGTLETQQDGSTRQYTQYTLSFQPQRELVSSRGSDQRT